MTRAVVLAVICIGISACRERGSATAERNEQIETGVAMIVLVDRRDTFDFVSVISGSRAFAQLTPYRSQEPPTGRREAAELPGELLMRLRKAASRTGLEPPFVPGGVAFSIATVGSSESEITWRYFDADDAEVGSCFDALRSAIQSVGTPVESVPNWILNEKVRAQLDSR